MIKKIAWCFLIIFSTNILALMPVAKKFDHQMHMKNVFAKNNFACTECHNMVQTKNKVFSPAELLSATTYKITVKEMCHQCHQGTAYPTAPKECITCHDSSDKLEVIKPLDHQNFNWKNGAHAQSARNDSSVCLNCHTNNQCIKCHTSRNPVMNETHTKNYRYFHSIEARMNPAKCESCHSETYCIKCHLGGVK